MQRLKLVQELSRLMVKFFYNIYPNSIETEVNIPDSIKISESNSTEDKEPQKQNMLFNQKHTPFSQDKTISAKKQVIRQYLVIADQLFETKNHPLLSVDKYNDFVVCGERLFRIDTFITFELFVSQTYRQDKQYLNLKENREKVILFTIKKILEEQKDTVSGKLCLMISEGLRKLSFLPYNYSVIIVQTGFLLKLRPANLRQYKFNSKNSKMEGDFQYRVILH